MKKIFALLALSFLASCSIKNFGKNFGDFKNSSNQESLQIEVSQDFVQGSEDIPLLVGMNKVLEESLGFDSNSGSIMSSSYQSKIDLEKVKDFYLSTLSQMGWKLENSDLTKTIFKRENEKLEIEFVNQNGEDLVKFFISSAL